MNATDRILETSDSPTLLPLCVASRGRSLKLNYRRHIANNIRCVPTSQHPLLTVNLVSDWR